MPRTTKRNRAATRYVTALLSPYFTDSIIAGVLENGDHLCTTSLRVFAELCRRAVDNPRGTNGAPVCQASADELSMAFGLSRTSVRNHIRTLRQHRLIAVHGQLDVGGRPGPNVYEILSPTKWLGPSDVAD